MPRHIITPREPIAAIFTCEGFVLKHQTISFRPKRMMTLHMAHHVSLVCSFVWTKMVWVIPVRAVYWFHMVFHVLSISIVSRGFN